MMLENLRIRNSQYLLQGPRPETSGAQPVEDGAGDERGSRRVAVDAEALGPDFDPPSVDGFYWRTI